MFFLRDANGQETGPFPAEAVRGWISAGQCSLFTEARREDQTRWRLLGAFTEFARVVPGNALVDGARRKTGFEMVAEGRNIATPAPLQSPPQSPVEARKTPRTERAVVPPPPPPVRPETRWKAPPPPVGGRSAQSRKTVRAERAPGTVPLTVVEEEKAATFQLPKWAWSVWLLCVGIWTLTAIGHDQFSIWELGLKVFLIPYVAAYFSWKKADFNDTVAGWVFLAVSLFLQLGSCSA